MPITLLDFIRSGGDFALMGAKDVELDDGTRLDAVVQQAVGALNAIGQTIGSLQNAVAPAKTVNLSKFESEGKIEQTNKDGSTVTYTFRFDDNGNPVEITDSDGNTTVLTW